MEFAARYQDGLVADVHDALCVIDLATEPAALVVLDRKTRQILDHWSADQVYLLHTRALELRIGNHAKPSGARIAVTGVADMRAAMSILPALQKDQRRDWWRQASTITLATLALGSVLIAYVIGVPLLADRLVDLVPPNWDTRVGDTATRQIEATLAGGGSFKVCDPDPSSPANTAIARFVTAAFDGLDSPFKPTVTVVRSQIPNAFSLPGGRTYFLSAMLAATQNQDEFEGVLAHELGHVYYRHGMHTLIATSATGLLVGFVLGDMTGLSAAGALGSALIDNRFSRQDETAADSFAARIAEKVGFRIRGLADLLERVAGDTAYSRALALFSNHPLTDDRRRALEALAPADEPPATPFFTDQEWASIRGMCPPSPEANPRAASTSDNTFSTEPSSQSSAAQPPASEAAPTSSEASVPEPLSASSEPSAASASELPPPAPLDVPSEAPMASSP